jgi:hypothetical protein
MAYCALLLIPMAVFLPTVVRRDPECLARRFRMKEKERPQRRVLAWGYPVLLAAFIILGLDRRFGWSDPPVRDLAGYREYREQVRYRLVPFVW